MALPLEQSIKYVLDEKIMLNPNLAFPQNRNCIVYGIGIDKNSAFETFMTKYCDQVHAFDCTVEQNADSLSASNHTFAFHQNICVGSKTNIDDLPVYGNNHRELVFQSLSATMKELNHTRIDLLKIDIEGSEWEVLETEILSGRSPLPRQILFELHTEGSNPRFVPPETVVGKDRSAVNNLFLRLFDIGYRVIGKQLNSGDGSCADFGLVLVDEVEPMLLPQEILPQKDDLKSH